MTSFLNENEEQLCLLLLGENVQCRSYIISLLRNGADPNTPVEYSLVTVIPCIVSNTRGLKPSAHKDIFAKLPIIIRLLEITVMRQDRKNEFQTSLNFKGHE